MEVVLIECMEYRKGTIFRSADENQLVFYLKAVQYRKVKYQLVIATLSPTSFSSLYFEPSMIISSPSGQSGLIHVELWRVIAVVHNLYNSFGKWRLCLLISAFFFVEISRRFHAEYIYHFHAEQGER